MFSMIEIMCDYTNTLQERFSKKDHGDVKLDPDNDSHNMELENNQPLGGIDNFFDFRMAVMMLMMTCNDSSTAELASNCSLVKMVRKAAMSVVGEVFVMEEAWNSIVVAVGRNASKSTGTAVAQLLAITAQIINEVRGNSEGESKICLKILY